VTGRASTIAHASRHRIGIGRLPEHRSGVLAVLAAAVLWSTGGVFIKWISLDAFGITLWRSLLAGLTLAAVLGVAPRPPWRERGIVWAMALSYAAMLLLFVIATKLTTSANAIFLQYTAPLYVLILSRWLIDEPPRRFDIVALAAAFGGMALFFVGRLDAGHLGGSLCAIASGVAFAVFLALLRHPRCDARSRPAAMVWGNALLVLVAIPVVLIYEPSAFTPGLKDASGLAFLGVVQIGLAYVVFTHGIGRVRALEASLVGMLEPVLNPVWVLLFLGERPGWWALAGGAIVIGAVAARTVFAERARRAA
jgi:drug/metabolite transporter (DMT)-like permease